MGWRISEDSEVGVPATYDRPFVNHFWLTCLDLEAQIQFFEEVMRMKRMDGKMGVVAFGEGGKRPRVKLRDPYREGLERFELKEGVNPLRSTPAWLGFETNNIIRAREWFRACGVEVMREVTMWPWGGTDVVIADGDGNPVRVVQSIPIRIQF